MQKKIQLAIPKPCHEKWNSFTPTAQGGFCGSCQKEVIDFTKWSEERLKAHFKNPSNASCGRFREHQLKVYTVEPNRAFMSKWLSVGITTLALIASREASAQTPKPKAEVEQIQPDFKIGKMVYVQQNATVIVSGMITVEEGSTMPGVNVTCKRTSESTVTDEFGKYKLTIKSPSSLETLVIDFIGMNMVEVVVDENQMVNPVDVVMVFDTSVLSGEIVVGGVCVRYPWYSPRRWWLGVRSLF